MFISLVKQECKMWIKSVVFYAYIIILFLFYVSQMGDGMAIKEPQPGKDNYGTVYSKDENAIMNGTLRDLVDEYECESFATYPFGFYKQVILSQDENEKMENCISKLTNKTKEEWQSIINNYYSNFTAGYDENGVYVQEEKVPWSLFVASDLSYDSFKKIMNEITDLIGSGSSYSEKKLKSHGRVAQTYEQAVAEYNDILQKDKVTGAYARLFSDYMGILLGILPAFFVTTRLIKEKRSHAAGVVYSKKASSFAIVLSRYLAMIIVLIIPVFLVSCFSLAQAVYIAHALHVSPDYLAYVKYCVGWLLPTVLFASAVSYLITELTESVLSIMLNVIIWIVSIFADAGNNLIYAGNNLIPRFNEVGKYQLFQDLFFELVRNRIIYTIISVILVGILVILYQMKRKGGYQIHGKVFKDFDSKYQA